MRITNKYIIAILFFYLIFFSTVSYSQKKPIAFFDEQNQPINNFQLNFFTKDSLSIFKSEISNTYNYRASLIKHFDSVYVIYDSFYSKKISINDFIKKDSLFLKKEIALDEVVINKKFERKELGVVSKNKNIFKGSDISRTDNIIEINVNNYIGANIESIHLYIFKKFRDIYNTKHKNENINIKFYLFQSNDTPNEDIINLLDKELIINTEKGEKGWVSINLSYLNIKIKDYKHLYIGYSTFGNPIAVGEVRKKRIIDTTLTSYHRSHNTLKAKWYKNYFKVYSPNNISEPAIKVTIKK